MSAPTYSHLSSWLLRGNKRVMHHLPVNFCFIPCLSNCRIKYTFWLSSQRIGRLPLDNPSWHFHFNVINKVTPSANVALAVESVIWLQSPEVLSLLKGMFSFIKRELGKFWLVTCFILFAYCFFLTYLLHLFQYTKIRDEWLLKWYTSQLQRSQNCVSLTSLPTLNLLPLLS